MPDFGKEWRPPRPETAPNQLADHAEGLRATLRLRDPGLIAARSGISYLTLDPGRGELRIPFWGDVCILSWPELMGYHAQDNPLPDFQQTLLLYYLITADGTPLTGKWVSFADLPDGRMYNAAFQGYSGDEIVKTFDPVGRDARSVPPERIDNPLYEFEQACLSCGGEGAEVGSASFVFQALPCIPLMVTYWLGDEDFPSSCKVLFDESARHYLPIDACAILASMLVRKLIRSKYG